MCLFPLIVLWFVPSYFIIKYCLINFVTNKIVIGARCIYNQFRELAISLRQNDIDQEELVVCCVAKGKDDLFEIN